MPLGTFHTGNMTVTIHPEIAAILERAVRDGRFASEEEALTAAVKALDPEASLPAEERARRAAIRSKSLFELMQESPFYGSDIEFERDRSPMRDVGFD
jgi:Arc/MetJ-type ribon-helix-helix transcriptional regulator